MQIRRSILTIAAVALGAAAAYVFHAGARA